MLGKDRPLNLLLFPYFIFSDFALPTLKMLGPWQKLHIQKLCILKFSRLPIITVHHI